MIEAVGERPKLVPPTKENLDQFEKDVQSTHGEARGTGVLFRAISGYKNAMRLANGHWVQIHKSVAFLNGERLQKEADTANTVARKFFSNLSTVALRKQCDIYEVDFDSFEELDDIVTALVEAQGWNGENN